jgi:tight adherence protein B
VALRLRAVALASEARTSSYVLAALPVVTGLALSVVNYDYIRPLFDTPSGNRLLLGAIAMLGTAGGVMRFMIKRSLR